MTTRFRTLFATLLLAVPAFAEPPKLAPEIVAPVPGMIIITAEPAAADDVLCWYSPDANFQFVPPHLLKDSHSLVAFVTKPGRYRLLAWADSTGYAETVVVVGDPPDPGPDPDPEPEPDSQFVKALKSAYQAEQAENRDKLAATLAGVYRRGINLARAGGSAGELFKAMLADARDKGLAGKLMFVQAIIQAELQKRLPSDPNAAIPVSEAVAVFGQIADALEGLSQ